MRRLDPQQHKVYKAERAIDATVWSIWEPFAPTPERFTNDALSLIRRDDYIGWRVAVEGRQAWWKQEKSRQRRIMSGRVRGVAALLLTSLWWAEVGGPGKVSVAMSTSTQSSRGGQYADGWGVKFGQTDYLTTGLVIAHELAHVLTYALKAATGHGAGYCGTYIACASVLLGGPVGEALDRAFVDTGCEIAGRLPIPDGPHDGLIAPWLARNLGRVPVAPTRPRAALAACMASASFDQPALF